ncbi:YncE family protein [Natrialbaceae archaeon A-gly3]
MQRDSTRRKFLKGSAAAGAVAVAGCLDGNGAEADADYEIWALDQGTDINYIYEPREDGEFEQVDSFDISEDVGESGLVPHMLHFSPEGEYVAIACTAGARTLVYDTDERDLVADLDTGAGSHFAGFTPDGESILVDVIGEGKIKRVDADLEAEEFDVAEEIDVLQSDVVQSRVEEFEPQEDDDGEEWLSPICHWHANGRSFHSLGPAVDNGGVVAVDYEEFEIVDAISLEETRTNCGTLTSPDEDKLFVTAGAPSNHEETGGVGEWYVYDTDTLQPYDPDTEELIEEDEDYTYEDVARDSEGYDAHGFWFTADDEEIWVLNRETNDGLVIDAETHEVIDEIEDFGPAPDIMWGSPDDEYLFVTLRGPNPLSGDAHAAEGETPGFSVMSVEDREQVDVIQPDGDNEDSDLHGIAVREL